MAVSGGKIEAKIEAKIEPQLIEEPKNSKEREHNIDIMAAPYKNAT